MSDFDPISKEICCLINDWELKLLNIDEDTLGSRRNSQKRTIKQILGHLIDSTSNNTHRVVHLQYQTSPFEFPNYATNGNNDRWIAIQNYQGEKWKEMVQLWKYSLIHFCHVIKNVNASMLGNEWIAGDDCKITLREMIEDFPRHLNLHLAEISELMQ